MVLYQLTYENDYLAGWINTMMSLALSTSSKSELDVITQIDLIYTTSQTFHQQTKNSGRKTQNRLEAASYQNL